MPINIELVGYGLRQASRRLSLDRARRKEAAYISTGEEAFKTQSEAAYAKAGQRTTLASTGAGGIGGTGGVSGGDRPGAPELPEFKAPEYDESKVAAKAQKIAAPRVRQLREAVRGVQATPFENPNVKRMTISQALQGYGTGLESVMAGARRGAVAEYGQEYGKEFTEAQMNFQTKVQGTMAQYGNLWSEYLQQLKAGPTSSGITGGLGIRSDPNYQPPTGLPPGDLNDPNTIGSRRIWRG